jgi:addiction module HigA family antidote
MARRQAETRPSHPGEVLRKEYLEPKGLTQRDLSDAIHVPYQRVNELVRGKRGVTPSTALRLGRFLGTSAAWWLELQARWDLYHAEQEEESELAAIELAALTEETSTLAGGEQVLYEPASSPGSALREARGGAVMPALIQLPPDVLALLDRRGKEQGLDLAEQVIEMVRAFLQGEVDPILQPTDPLLTAPVAEGSGLGDLATDHDRYLYGRERLDRTER